MRVGVVFPQIEIGADPGAIRAYAGAVAQLGYQHVLVYDHVLGADPARRPGWSGAYSVTDTFHEPFVLFGYLAGISELELATGVIVLPQRQTALVAKQAAEVDILCGGRLRLGVGIGWNDIEYEALNEDFRTRGRRIEDQVDVMRRLWTEPVVDVDSPYHRITGAGLAPLPVQRPIPVWMGATSARRALLRVGRVSDGWMPQFPPGARLDDALAVVQEGAREAGRDPGTLGLEGRTSAAPDKLDGIADIADAWRRTGATHLSINTMRAGLPTVDDHIAVLADAANVLALG